MHDMTLKIEAAVDPESRMEALAHIERSMREKFGCEPPPTTGLAFVARAGGRIVGSLVIEGASGNGPLPIETHYAFDEARSPYPYVRHDIVQATRWTASVPEASRLVVLATMRAAFHLGKRLMLIEAKPYAIARLAELGMDFREIEGAEVLLETVRESVGPEGMKYFTDAPAPSLYLCDMGEALRTSGSWDA